MCILKLIEFARNTSENILLAKEYPVIELKWIFEITLTIGCLICQLGVLTQGSISLT